MRKILILEDAGIGGRTLAALAQRGYEASWFVGVSSIHNGTLNGIRADLSLEAVSLSDYCLAFVDGFLYIGGLMGWEAAVELNRHMITIGTSSIGKIGTQHQIEKEEMLDKLDEHLQLLAKCSTGNTSLQSAASD